MLAHAQPSTQDQRSAAEAYDRGTAAYLARDYARAAQWFETANRLAPAAAALVQAARSNERAGNALRAANLALRLQALYADDRTATRTATEILGTSTSQFFRIEVSCDGCTVQLDGTLLEHTAVFVEPDSEHNVIASFETGDRTQTVRGGSGQVQRLAFTAPPPSEAHNDHTDPTTGATGGGIGVIPWWVTLIGGVATVGLASIFIWSGIDTLSGVPAYEMSRTPEALADGQSREARTNWLMGFMIGTGVATIALAIFTDWTFGGSASATVQAGGFDLGSRGRF
jgi:hypothetical protein